MVLHCIPRVGENRLSADCHTGPISTPHRAGTRHVLFIGCAFLTARLFAVVIVGSFTDNLWALRATTFLHGSGDATMHLMKAL